MKNLISLRGGARIVAPLIFMCVLLTAANAQVAPDAARIEAAEHWRALTRLDMEAAYALLRDNHPGMAPEIGDRDFVQRVERAHLVALGRVSQVENYYGYRAVIAAFGNGVGDAHVGAGFGLTREYTVWPGFLTRSRGENFVVVRAPGDDGNVPPEGARLMACDGIQASEFAQQRIGEYWANWEVEAERSAQSWRLLVNDRNPFSPPPRTCVFETGNAEIEVVLEWRRSTYETIFPVIQRASPLAAAGYGVRRLANGAYWISLEHLDAGAEQVIAAAQAAHRDLSAAPYVVVDVRGNGGGSSSYGDRLADILLGQTLASSGGRQVSVWRASQGNADAMHAFADDVRTNRSDNNDLLDWANETAEMLSSAVGAGQGLAPPLPRRTPPTPPFADPAGGALERARIFILTDYSCFSSCLLMVDTFKRRGAVQLGLPTAAATRYMETRQVILPSGLAAFSTLQKVSLGSPDRLGPYIPAARYDGDIADTTALEHWVAQLVGSRR
ncbi:MAG: hypothetical protein ABL889_10205 [Terricaulis sp.]